MDREKIFQRTLLTQRQMGNVSGTISFLFRNPDRTSDYKSHLKCDLGDLLLQVKMLIKDCGLDEMEVLQLAYDRYDECKKEFASKGKSQYFV
jgi:hypothetical protein